MDSIVAALQELRASYVERLPGVLAELQVLVDALGREGGRLDVDSLAELHRSLHKIAGSAGTFGFPRLGLRARELEQTVKGWLDNPGLCDEVTIKVFASAIAQMQEWSLQREDGVMQSSSPSVDEAAVTVHDASEMSVWLVEDDRPLAESISQNLGQYGYRVRHFTRFASAEQALQGEDASAPDLLLMDVMFAEERLDATQALADSPLRTCGAPLLFISSLNDFDMRVRAVRLGAAGFLDKPLYVPRLVDRIEALLEVGGDSPYRVMIVDDDHTLAEHYRLVLSAAGMEVCVVNEPREVVEAVASFRPELVLMDMQMPDYNGQELAAVIRLHDAWISLPIVYLSAETDTDLQLDAMGQGADDFLTKPITDHHLIAAVRLRITRARQLDDLVSRDSLTGLLKHSRIKEELDIALARARRSGKSVSVVMCDIDHFKRVNDNHGHATGDQVIKAMAHLLKQRLRKSDVIGRYGGEEFAAILPECDEGQAMAIMDDIRQRFAAMAFVSDSGEFQVTMSAGVASNRQGAESLLVVADQALYQAKNGGRNQIRLYEAKEQV